MAEKYRPFENHVDYIDLPENTSLSEIADLMNTQTPIKAEALTDKQKEEFNEYYYKNYQPVINNNQPQNRLAMEGIEDYKNVLKYKSFERLNDGKIKLIFDNVDDAEKAYDTLKQLKNCKVRISGGTSPNETIVTYWKESLNEDISINDKLNNDYKNIYNYVDSLYNRIYRDFMQRNDDLIQYGKDDRNTIVPEAVVTTMQKKYTPLVKEVGDKIIKYLAQLLNTLYSKNINVDNETSLLQDVKKQFLLLLDFNYLKNIKITYLQAIFERYNQQLFKQIKSDIGAIYNGLKSKSTTLESLKEEIEETHKITFHNNIDQDILDSIKNPLDKLNELTKCSRYAGTVLAKLFDKDRYKDIKLCLGNIISENSYDYSTDITHVWLVVDGHILETRFPSGNYKRVCIEELTLNKNKDLYTQVEEFINRVKNKVIPMSEALTFEKPGEYVNTLDELFAKYPGLDNPEESGVEFYQFRDTDNPNEDLLVITSSEEEPNSFTFSGFDKEDYKVGQYLLNFPYNARTMIFDDVQSIDKHLTDNKGFKLPGYTYED